MKYDQVLKHLRKYILIPGIVFTMLFLGCAKNEDDKIVVVENEPEQSVYGQILVTREDVILSKALTATYMQLSEQTVSFPVGQKRVSKVHVHQGDSVKKGDLLIELAHDNLQEKIDELEYRIAKNELQLKYLDAAEKFEEAEAYNRFVYDTREIEEEDLKNYEKKEDAIARDYTYKREDYEDEIEFDKKELSKLRSELSGSRILSAMNGIVYSVADDLEGSTTRKDEVVMTIVDNASGRFETKEPDYASYFHENEAAPMNIVYGSASGEYEVIPYRMDTWGETQQFEILSGPENEGIDVGTSGTIHVTLDKREKVLALPIGAVYYADGEPYVYMLDENNFRQIVWIKTGLTGDDKVEILSGLKEGDRVVYQ